MGGIVDWLSGASGSANKAAGNVGGYYDHAIDQSNSGYDSAAPGLQAAYANAVPQVGATFDAAAPKISAAYGDAEQKLIDSTGSPAAAQFAALQAQGLAPAFKQQQDALPGQLAALGLTGSGAAGFAAGNLGGQQASALAAADAPLYSNAESQYGSLLGAGAGALTTNAEQGAGAQSNLIGAGANAYGNLLGQKASAAGGIAGAGAGAQGQTYTNTYNQGIADFYSGLEAAGSAAAGVPGGGGGVPSTSTQYSSTPAQNNASLAGIYAPGSSANAVNTSGQLTSDPYYGAAPTAIAPASQAQAPYNPYGGQPAPYQSMPPANYNPYLQAA